MDVWSNKVGQIKKRDNWSGSDSGRTIQKVQESRSKSYGHVMIGEEGHNYVWKSDGDGCVGEEKGRKPDADVDGQSHAQLRREEIVERRSD